MQTTASGDIDPDKLYQGILTLGLVQTTIQRDGRGALRNSR
jgi:hypothetical protein